MIIEEMKKADAPSIAAIERACFASPWTRQGIEEEADNPSSHFLKATDEETGVTAGYLGVQEICGEAYIPNIAVIHADFHRYSFGLEAYLFVLQHETPAMLILDD